MKWKPDRPSYLLGILFGIMVGFCVGYMVSLLEGLHRIGTDQEGEVVVSIATLRKLQTNDVASATRLLERVVVRDYVDHTKKMDNWFLALTYQNSKLVERVDNARKTLPGLDRAIEETKSETAANTASHTTSLTRRP